MPELRIEFVMNKVMKLLQDHREDCAQSGRSEPCCEERTISVKIAALSEVGMCDQAMYDENGQWIKNDDNDTLAIFLSCSECAFFDFESLL